ncbi:putative defense protein 3 [Hypanus sabinus]|uniref:putative defense protein 3 n=1 Tax=Hypanus sabinus TaxID=79690 RepID=UPI0028C3C3AE|nr:putative defense protein 3 [Hypanus sabinus]
MPNLGFRCVVPGLLALCLPLASALSNGAPLSSCGSMAPNHINILPQNTSSPHSINASRVNGTMQVRIMGPTYKGLLLQARKPNENTAVGTWSSPPANTKTIKCFNAQDSAMTHANTSAKDSDVVYTWNPPSGECIKVMFTATVAQGRSVYWLGVTSNEIMMNCNDNGNGAVRTTSGLVLVLIWPLLYWLHSEG